MTNLFSAASKIANPKPQLAKAALIYQHTYKSGSSLIEVLDQAKQTRGNLRGALTETENDLLRAALVMTCAGLDATIKQAIRDCIGSLLEGDPEVLGEFEKFISRRLGSSRESFESTSANFLAKVLADSDPRGRLTEEYIRDLTGDSLQSVEEIRKALVALGISKKMPAIKDSLLREAFKARNQIIHELDIDFEAPKRKRRMHSKADIVQLIEYLLRVAHDTLFELNKQL